MGPLALERDGAAVELPRSRKVRALLAYLVLAPRPPSRKQLCELLWEDEPTDPRGELRWCLSKLRNLIGQRIVAVDETIALDLDGCYVDALEVERAAREGLDTLSPERQRELAALLQGEFLEGLEIERSPAFGAWVTAQRRRFRAVQAALLERLAASPDDEEAFSYLDQWLELAPFDRRVHELLLTRLARRRRLREAEEHLARAAAMFDAEGLDFAPIQQAWTAARQAARATSEVSDVGAPPRRDASGVVLEQSRLGGAPTEPPASRRASIAVMPFTDQSGGVRGLIADALAHDITTRLAKLRSMFVIAHGSTVALAERRIGPEEAGRMLNVDFVVGGTVRTHERRLAVTVELVETHTARIVWSEILNHAVDDAFFVLDEIGNRIVASIASEIETIERNRAILQPPNSLDAWETLHRGLWHMYRFTREDNARAQCYFQDAVKLDPTFSRAWAGLSFTHFQNAFSGWGAQQQAIDQAFEAAGQSLMADDRDPGAHNAMGRALWLRGRNDEAELELRRAIDLSPNFALGHYSLSFVQSQAGDPAAAIRSSDTSRALSPFDPLLFAMLGNRAIALARLGQYAEAAESASKGAARPNANPHVRTIAACTLALAGRVDAARAQVAQLRQAHARYGIDDFLRAFRLDADGALLFRRGAAAAGL